MPAIAQFLSALALAAPPSGGATHRTTVPTSPLRPELEVVDQGIEDRGGIEKSFRVLPLDLRAPTGFQQVYRVPGRDDLMMRGNGALFAVFPRSAYMRTAFGTIPLAPADVHFSIGMPGGFTFPGGSLKDDGLPPDPRIAKRVDSRVRPTPVTLFVDPSTNHGDPATERVNEMPAISEAPKAARAGAAAEPLRIRSMSDLRLGPPVLARE